MKKALLLCSVFVFLLWGAGPALASKAESVPLPAQGAPTAAALATATHFTAGVMQTGTFGSFPETHTYTVYLQGNKGVAFQAAGTVASMAVYSPSGAYVGSIPLVQYSTRYGVLVTPNESGNYTIQLYGSLSSYSLNCVPGHAQTTNTNTAYNRTKAAQYARDYAINPNPAYPYYPLQEPYNGDCANFVSQALFAGGMPMRTGGSNDSYWYSNSGGVSPTWKGAFFFMRHWTKVKLSSYYGRAYSVRAYTKDYILNNKTEIYNFLSVGDVVQLTNTNSEGRHTQMITKKNSATDVRFCQHSYPVQESKNWFDFIYESAEPGQWVLLIKIRNS